MRVIKKLSYISLCLFIAITTVFVNLKETSAADGLKIHYIDADSGDSIYIECEGQNMLIDGAFITQANGSEETTNRTPVDEQMNGETLPIQEDDPYFLDKFRDLLDENDNCSTTNYLKKLNVKHLNYIVLSHPHYDHVGGLIQVVNQCTYDKLYYNGVDYSSETKYFRYFKMLVEDNVNPKPVEPEKPVDPEEPEIPSNPEVQPDEKEEPYVRKHKQESPDKYAPLEIPTKNQTWNIGSAKVTVLSDASHVFNAHNNRSIVLRLDYGNRSFLLTGDSQVDAQRYLMTNQLSQIQNIDVLKVPHHGHVNNDYGVDPVHSGNYEFFVKTNPVISVIHCGYKNTSTTLPTTKVVNDLSMSDIYTTKYDGTIVLECNGQDIVLKHKKGEKKYHFTMIGDVNGNGRIDAADYLMIKDTIMGKLKLDKLQTHQGDVNKNIRMDAADYLKIRDFIMGKIQKL